MADDVFDEVFRNRLIAFQRDHGLVPDATLGPKSWTKLTEVATAAPERSDQPRPESTKPDETTKPEGPPPVVPLRITAEEFPLLVKLATLCVDEAGAKQFLLEELDLDIDEIRGEIEEALA